MIDADVQHLLDPAIDRVINSIREIESDFPEISTEESLHYVITKVLSEMYSKDGLDDMISAVGVLECAKFTHTLKGQKNAN